MIDDARSYAELLYKKYQTLLLSKKQACQELGISRATLDRFREEGKLRSRKVGGQVRFHVKDIASASFTGI